MIEHLADRSADSTDPFGWDFVIGLALIGLAIAVWAVGRNPKARRSVGRASGRAAIGTLRATSRPIRALGRRSRSGLIGHWGRGVVGCENRAMKAAAAGKHDRARFLRGVGDAMIGSSRITCHVPGCDWEQDPPSLPEVVRHLRSHRDDKKPDTDTDTDSKPNTDTSSSGDQPATNTNTNTGEKMSHITAAETIPELAILLDQRLIPAATLEVDLSTENAIRQTNLATAMQLSLENMSSLGMPAATLAQLGDAVEATNLAAAEAKTVAARNGEVRDSLVAARQAIRGQEAVADVAAAAGGAMDKAAYTG